MAFKVLNVFYGADNLPYKDKDRSVHFPLLGNAFQGASDTTEIHFYFGRIGEPNTTWVAVSKLPNGKIGSKVLSVETDEELGEDYAVLSLSSFYTQYKGSLFISLQGYNGEVQVEYDQEQELYVIKGTPTIQATGSIKLNIAYATQFVGSGEESNADIQSVAALLGTKLNIANGIVVLTNIANTSLSSYSNGQLFYDKATKKYYRYDGGAYELVDDTGVLASNNVLVRYIVSQGNISLNELFVLFGYKQFLLGYDSSSNGVIDYLCQFRLSAGALNGVRATRLSDLHSYYGDITNLPLSSSFASLISDTYKDNIIAKNDLVDYTKKYVRHIEVDATLTAQEVYDTIGSDLRVFSFTIDDIMYLAMFVTNNDPNKSLILWNEENSYETSEFSLSSLFMNVIADTTLRVSSVPVVAITQPSTTLIVAQYQKLLQANSCISYNGRTYFKANDTGSYIEFVCVDYDFTSGEYQVAMKYEISVNKSTRVCSTTTTYLNFYNKTQIDQMQATNRALFGTSVDLSIDSNYDLVVKLLNANGEVISQDDIDLPLESIITSARFYETYSYQGSTYTNVLVITLATTSVPTIIPIGALVQGLEKEAFIQVDNIGTPLTSEQLTIANLPNARIKYGNTYFIKANDNGTYITFANLVLGIAAQSGYWTIEKQILTLNKSNGTMTTTTSLTNIYDKDQIDTLLGAKANANEVYTISQADSLFRTEAQVNSQIDTKISGLSRINVIDDLEENKTYDYRFVVTTSGELVMRITEIE